MSIKQFAKILGRRGGKERARRLAPHLRSAIASLGGQARAQSFKAAERIEQNFRYLEVVRLMTPSAGDAQDLEFLEKIG